MRLRLVLSALCVGAILTLSAGCGSGLPESDTDGPPPETGADAGMGDMDPNVETTP